MGKYERRRKVIVRFTKLGASAFWQMVCNPTNMGLKPEDWYRPDSPTEEVEVAKLHKFADTKLCETKKKMVTDAAGQDREIEEKDFIGGLFSLRKDLKARAEKIVDHYREKAKKGKGRLLPIHFAELEAGINNKPMPTDDENMDIEDPEDAAELAKLLPAPEDEQPGAKGATGPCAEVPKE